TVVVALAVTEPVLSADAVAVFGYSAQLANVVALVMCTECETSGAMSPNEQFRTCGAPGAIEQAGAAGLIAQEMPLPGGPEGSTSWIFTFVAVPAPSLKTVIVKPIGSPALTVAASAVFRMWIPGHWTEVVAWAVTSALFVACAVAVFG